MEWRRRCVRAREYTHTHFDCSCWKWLVNANVTAIMAMYWTVPYHGDVLNSATSWRYTEQCHIMAMYWTVPHHGDVLNIATSWRCTEQCHIMQTEQVTLAVFRSCASDTS